MLTGRMPVDAESTNIVSYLHKLEVEEPIPLRRLNENVSPELERVVLQALRTEPRERFFDVHEMADALARLPSARVHPQRRVNGLARKPMLGRRSIALRRYVMVAGVLGVTLIILILVVAVLQDRNRPLQAAVINTNARGSAETIVPTVAEIAQAQRRLGSQGFIAYIACSLDSQFQAVSAREMRDLTNTYGLAFRVYNSSNDAYQALTLIEQARLEGARAIILCPLKPELLIDSLTSIQSAGIPLVLTDTLADSYGGVMLEIDNDEVGRLAGDFTAQTLEGGNPRQVGVVILDAPDYSYSEARVQGFIEGLSTAPDTVEIIGRHPTATNQAASEAAVAELIQRGQAIDAIFSVVDTGAYGAVAALSQAGISPDSVIVTSVNAESLALNQIYNQRYLSASIDIARDASARGAVDAAVKLLGGGTLPGIITLPSGIVITRDIMISRTS
jgi:ABC-type sugar transport system substrate-binding protein